MSNNRANALLPQSPDGVAENPCMPQHSGVQTKTEPKSESLEEDTEPPKATPVTVCMLRAVSKFTVPVQVEELMVDAVLDSAAEVTIIFDRVYASLKIQPDKLYDVRLDTAGRQMSVQGFVPGPVKFKIGHSDYNGSVYVAPIEQDMLFGVDILRKGSAAVDMGRNVFRYKGQEILMNSGGGDSKNPRVARVTVAKRIVIPPNSAAHVPCKMATSMPDYVIEPTQSEKVFGPRVVRSAGTEPVVCILNCSDRYRLLRKGKDIATASPVEDYLQEDQGREEGHSVVEPTVDVCEVSKPAEEGNKEVPDTCSSVSTTPRNI